MGDMNGTYLKKLRLDKGETQKDLARAFHYTQKAVSAWENGRNSLTSELLHLYAEHFELDYNSFCTNYFNKAKKPEANATDGGEAPPSDNVIVSEVAASSDNSLLSEPAEDGENAAAPECTEASKTENLVKKRKLHPILKTFLITLAVMVVLLGIAIGVFIGIAKSYSNDNFLQGNVYYYADIPLLCLIAFAFLIVPTLLITIIFSVIYLITKHRRK